MTRKSNIKQILLSFIVLIMAAGITYVADSPIEAPVIASADNIKIQ